MINVTVIGFGCVGSSLSLLLLNNKHALRLNIIDPAPECEGAFLDFSHGIGLYENKELHINDEELFLQADFIFYAAGVPNVHGESRLSTAKQNILLSKEIFEARSFVRSPFIIVITNPVDIVSHAVYRFSGLPSEKVIGTGTFLDSVRLAYYLSNASDYKATDFNTMVLGEHGSSQVPIYSRCEVKGQPLLHHPEFTEEKLNHVEKLTRNAAYQIRETQEGTTYGVSKCAETILNYLLEPEEHSLTLSMLTNEHYRSLLQLDHDIYIGMPVTIKNGTIKINNESSFSDRELQAYRESAYTLAKFAE